MSTRSAFTIIELLIAVALSTAVAYVAFAGLRVAASTVTASERLSLENRMLREGCLSAFAELDFWSAYDRPGFQPLRDPGRSSPFAALDPTAAAASEPGQHDPRSWWRGYGPHTDTSERGDYALFSRVAHPDGGYRAWLPERMAMLIDTLGYYGMVDQLPGNMVYQYYGEDGRAPPDIARCMTLGDGPMDFSLNVDPGEGGDPRGPRCRDIYAMTIVGFLALTADPAYVAANVHRHLFAEEGAQGDRAFQWSFHHLFERCEMVDDPLPLRPTAWPSLRTGVLHYVHYAQQVNLARVTIVSPLTGETLSLRFTATGTTLRGARRQRGILP